MKKVIFALGVLFVFACSKTEVPSTTPVVVLQEEAIKFTTNLDTGTFNVSDTLPLNISVSSKLTTAGLLYSILINWTDSAKQIFKLDTSLNASTLNLKIPGLKKAGNYSLSVTLTSKTSSTNILNKIIPIVNKPAIIFYSNNLLDSVSLINKTTSWYHTNKSFDQIFNVQKSLYWGFQQVGTGFVPFSVNQKADYWNDLGGYVYTDLTGDGKKDLWAYYWKNPWPTNAKGLHLFTEYEATPNVIDLQTGLTQVRKISLADLDNDGKKEIVLFSSGYDANPFPGDSIGIFNITSKKYKYLSNDIGYFHGGATGDINNDGLIDIVAYSGGSAVIPIHPTAYINKGGGDMELSNSIFKNFTKSDNFYTVELFDINNDGSLDLLLGGQNKLKIVLNKSGQFDMSSAISVPIENGIELMDISFLDFDKDGRVDLLTMSNLANYKGYALRLYLQKSNGQFTEDSKSYFNVTQGSATNGWIKWIHLFDYDKDGDLDVVGDGIFGDVLGYNPNNLKVVYWRNDQGKFIQVIK
jgi:hypothetical protein